MGKPWCDGLKVVDAPQGATPKPVTFVLPFYDNAVFLRRQVAWWSTFPAWLRASLTAIIVDDGSPMTPAADVLCGLTLPFSIRLFRIEEDRRWNWLAARNIGMHHAVDGWCLLTDMDHVAPESTATAVVYGEHDTHVIHAFSRIEHTGEHLTPHSASFLMTRELFWAIGGYDEALSGHYGTDGEYRRRAAAVAPIQVLSDRLIRHEHVDDSSTTRYKRKQPGDAGVRHLVAARGKGWRPKTLSFAYHEVALAQAVSA